MAYRESPKIAPAAGGGTPRYGHVADAGFGPAGNETGASAVS